MIDTVAGVLSLVDSRLINIELRRSAYENAKVNLETQLEATDKALSVVLQSKFELTKFRNKLEDIANG